MSIMYYKAGRRPYISPAPPLRTSSHQNHRVSDVAQPAIQEGTCKFGICKSKVLRAVLITTAALLLVFLLVSNPVGWVASAICVSIAIAKLFIAAAVIVPNLVYYWRNKEEMNSELSSIQQWCTAGSPPISSPLVTVGSDQWSPPHSPPERRL